MVKISSKKFINGFFYIFISRIILDVITKPLLIEPPKLPKTLINFRVIRRAYRVYKFKPNPKYLSKIFRKYERAATDRTIDIYMIKGL